MIDSKIENQSYLSSGIGEKAARVVKRAKDLLPCLFVPLLSTRWYI